MIHCIRCLIAAHSAAAKLADQLKALSPASAFSATAGAADPSVAEGALLLARLATAVAEDTPALQVHPHGSLIAKSRCNLGLLLTQEFAAALLQRAAPLRYSNTRVHLDLCPGVHFLRQQQRQTWKATTKHDMQPLLAGRTRHSGCG